MATLGIPSNTIEVLQKYHFNFQKKFGQNFLIDTHVLEKIMNAAQISKDDCVVEVGPGIGTMTQYLAERAGHVVAVEIDKALIPILSDTLSAYDNVEVINEDILKVDLNRLVQEKNGGRPIKVVANLPYYITTPIIMGLFESHVPGTYAGILMDMMMPNMDGVSATRAIRALARADAKTIPIIAMTANAFDEDAKASFEAGMNAHLAKPFQMEKVVAVIALFCRKA